jgi:hypothetical protein
MDVKEKELSGGKHMRAALTGISIATLLVMATGTSCAMTPIGPGTGGGLGPNQACDLCYDTASKTNVEMHLYIFVPGQPLMNDFVAAEAMLLGADSTAMGFSSPGCAASGSMAHTAIAGAPDGGFGSVNPLQNGPPPPRAGVAGAPVTPPPPGAPDQSKPAHNCAAAGPAKNLCAEPLGAGGILQPDGVVYFQPIAGGMNDYRFVPCKYARDNQIRSYDDVKRLTADQWIHFTGTHSGKNPISWAITRQP